MPAISENPANFVLESFETPLRNFITLTPNETWKITNKQNLKNQGKKLTFDNKSAKFLNNQQK